MKKEKRITAFIQSLGGGGAQGVLVTVMNYYKSQGHGITVVVERLDNDVNSKNLDKNIHINSLNVNSTKSALKKTIEYIRQNEMDCLFAFSPEIAVNMYIARCLTRKKVVIIGRCINTLSYEYKYATSFFRKYISKSLVKMVYGKLDRIVVQADNMGRDLVRNFSVSEDKIYVINNPLSEKYEVILEDSQLYQKENFILFVGRLEKQKGLYMLLEAFSMINDKSVELKLIGKGNMKKDLLEEAKSLGIDMRICFIDFTTDIENYYKKARITVMSSYYEGFPNVLAESIACGTPVVSYDLPSGPSDIVIDGVNGYLAKYLDVQDLSQTIDKALNKKWNEKDIKKTAWRFRKNYILKKYQEVLQF